MESVLARRCATGDRDRHLTATFERSARKPEELPQDDEILHRRGVNIGARRKGSAESAMGDVTITGSDRAAGEAPGRQAIEVESAMTAFAFPPGADTMSLTNSSVILGSSPSVWPLSSRTTSAITRPSLAFG